MHEAPTDAAVRTTLRILVAKGHLRIEQDGPALRLLADGPARRRAALRAAARAAHLLRRLHRERAGDAARHPARRAGRRDAAAHEAADRQGREGRTLTWTRCCCEGEPAAVADAARRAPAAPRAGRHPPPALELAFAALLALPLLRLRAAGASTCRCRPAGDAGRAPSRQRRPCGASRADAAASDRQRPRADLARRERPADAGRAPHARAGTGADACVGVASIAWPTRAALLLAAWLAGATVAAGGAGAVAAPRAPAGPRAPKTIADPAWRAPRDALGARLGLRRPARLLVSARVGTPMAGGVWRPADLPAGVRARVERRTPRRRARARDRASRRARSAAPRRGAARRRLLLVPSARVDRRAPGGGWRASRRATRRSSRSARARRPTPACCSTSPNRCSRPPPALGAPCPWLNARFWRHDSWPS